MMLFQRMYRLVEWIEESLEEYLRKHEHLFPEEDFNLPVLCKRMREELPFLKKVKTGWVKHIHKIAALCWMDFAFEYLDKVTDDLHREYREFEQLCIYDLDKWTETIDHIRQDYEGWKEEREDEFELHYSVTLFILDKMVEKLKIFENVVDAFENHE
jgi:hypothetical protein